MNTINPFQMGIKKKWLENEHKFSGHSYNGDSDQVSKSEWTGSKVLLLGVHGVNHYNGPNEDDLKACDLWTGSLVETLASDLNLSYFVNLRRDPLINPYLGKTLADCFLEEIANKNPDTIILDIHGAKDNTDFIFALGTSLYEPNENQVTLIEKFDQSFNLSLDRNAKEGKYIVNQPNYTANGRNTMTYRCLRMGLRSSLQIEITKRFRDPSKQESNFTLLALSNFITLLEQS